ncbi:MAG: hypothetical protein SWK76_13880 [Actinomycetota bacterium]|nr:hypothetical protein [Actinomycetota bacterium]
MVNAGLGFLDKVPIPDDAGEVVLFISKKLGVVKDGVSILDTLNWILPLPALVFFAAAVIISGDRRRFLMVAGTYLAMAVSLILVDYTKA